MKKCTIHHHLQDAWNEGNVAPCAVSMGAAIGMSWTTSPLMLVMVNVKKIQVAKAPKTISEWEDRGKKKKSLAFSTITTKVMYGLRTAAV